MFQESHPRSIVKTLTIRVLFSLSHLVNGFIISGSWVIGASIVGLAALINMCLHWGHERVWNHFQWNRNPQDGLFFKEGHPRTISKSVTWRILISISNFVIPFIITGSWKAAAAFFTIATIMNAVIYYSHERIWNRISWGKKAKEEPISET